MPDRSGKRRPGDLNSLAASIVADATDEDKSEPTDTRDPAAVALGRKGGLKGGRRERTSSRRGAVRGCQKGR